MQSDGPHGVAVTVDVDWAPDFAILDVAERLIHAGVKATWFVTHATPVLETLRRRPDLFELGIHPNFLPGSTHGENPQQVLSHCHSLVPDARSLRTHSLVYSSPLFSVISRETSLDVDASILLPGAYWARPVGYWVEGRSIVRFTTSWEDDYEQTLPSPHWSAGSWLSTQDELIVLTFHPIHIALNSSSPDPYARLRNRVRRVQDATGELVGSCASEGAGTSTMFDDVLTQLCGTGKSVQLGEFADRWRLARGGA